jgi:ATP-dependent DNA helicase RecG
MWRLRELLGAMNTCPENVVVMNEKYLHRRTQSALYLLARQNRKVSTEAEEILWNNLRSRRLNGFKFRRQQPMGSFILDFFCLEKNLAIEVDGGYHDEEKQKIYDEQRTIDLEALHVTVVRFSNDEVINSLQFVLDTIVSHLIPGPSPSAVRQEKGEVAG